MALLLSRLFKKTAPMLLLAPVLFLIGCGDDSDDPAGPGDGTDDAYLSIQVDGEPNLWSYHALAFLHDDYPGDSVELRATKSSVFVEGQFYADLNQTVGMHYLDPENSRERMTVQWNEEAYHSQWGYSAVTVSLTSIDSSWVTGAFLGTLYKEEEADSIRVLGEFKMECIWR